MGKLALQADLCYNETLNIACPGDVVTIPGRDERKVVFFRMDTIPQKRCTVCNNLFPATPDFFHRDRYSNDGLCGKCKECKCKMKNARSKLPEVRKRVSAYNKIYHKAYYSQPENHEHKVAQDRLYHDTHKEQHKTNGRKYYETHKERHKELGRIYAETHKERLNEVGRIRQHQRRVQKRSISGTHTLEQIQDLLKRQKHKCYYCQAKFAKKQGKYIYHIDHTFPINRVAGTDIPANDISYLVLACPTCNISKNDKFPWEWHKGGRLL